jgi:predicted GIY-YIG superfamily endonuclease
MVTVYRLYDACHDLLYVGIASNVIRRTSQHLASKEWFRDVRTATFEHCATRDHAEQREREIIRIEQPRHNIRRYDRVPVSSVLPVSLIRAIEAKAKAWSCTKSEAAARLIAAGAAALKQDTPAVTERRTA